MSRFLITVNGNADREKAARWCMAAKPGMRIEFKQAKRSGEQNDKLWAMLTEVSEQVQWHGIKLSPDDWKFIFLDALKRELRVVPNIDGNGFVNLGRSSSDLSKDEMSNLIELIHAFGANHGVTFHDPDSNSVEMLPGSQPDTPADEAPPTPHSPAGGNSEDSPAGRASGEGGGDDAASAAGDTSSPPLPEGWGIEYAAALRRAQKKESLPKYATQFWDQRGGWAAHKDGPNGLTAVAIYDAFWINFGNKDAIEAELRELL